MISAGMNAIVYVDVIGHALRFVDVHYPGIAFLTAIVHAIPDGAASKVSFQGKQRIIQATVFVEMPDRRLKLRTPVTFLQIGVQVSREYYHSFTIIILAEIHAHQTIPCLPGTS